MFKPEQPIQIPDFSSVHTGHRSISHIPASQDNLPVVFLSRHSFSPPYSSGFIPSWQYEGATELNEGFIRLTPDRQSKRGRLWNKFRYLERSWQAIVAFRVMGQGAKLFGDGFAFWYTKDKLRDGMLLGSADDFIGLSLMFDTYDNEEGKGPRPHPYITAYVNDGSTKFDHDALHESPFVGGCTSKFREQYDEAKDGIAGISPPKPSLIRITYLAPLRELRIEVDAKNEGTWQECTVVEDVELPSGYHFGFSASTGQLADNHDIFEVKIGKIDDEVISMIAEKDKNRDGKESLETQEENPTQKRNVKDQGFFFF